MVTNSTDTERVLDALGNQTRREILSLLREAPMPVGEMAERLPVSRPAVSKHLRILEDAGLVEYKSIGTRNVFRLRSKGFWTARAYVESFWDEALASFQQLTERQPGAET